MHRVASLLGMVEFVVNMILNCCAKVASGGLMVARIRQVTAAQYWISTKVGLTQYTFA
jgi:hypothetical protein